MQIVKEWNNENEEITIGTCINWDTWALPFAIQWWNHKNATSNLSFSFYIDILCFRFYIEYWSWKKRV